MNNNDNDKNLQKALSLIKHLTARKVSAFGVILVRIQSECGKLRTKINPNTDTFYAVSSRSMF